MSRWLRVAEDEFSDELKIYDVLYNKKVTRNDGEKFTNLIEKLISSKREDEEYYEILGHILLDGIVTKDNGELFNKLVNKVINNQSDAFALLEAKILTKDDGELFNKALSNVLKHPKGRDTLLEYNVMSEKDIDDIINTK